MSIQDHDFTVLEGFALGGTSVAQNQLGPYIQQAIDQVRQLDIRCSWVEYKCRSIL